MDVASKAVADSLHVGTYGAVAKNNDSEARSRELLTDSSPKVDAVVPSNRRVPDVFVNDPTVRTVEAASTTVPPIKSKEPMAIVPDPVKVAVLVIVVV